ncbi:MAG: OmcA/MtrC family decaheme c-type cytochrome [Halioglobus sp.]|nr:OmcA/MtrC family decaheme c-type cytochrome [Halioglobus sp.]
MAITLRNCLLAGVFGLLAACGGGGGGDRAAGVDPGPPPPGGPVTPPAPDLPEPNPAPYAEAGELYAFITGVSLNAADQPVVQFQLSDGDNTAITDLSLGNLRFVIAKLQASPLGNLTGAWQSYINRIEQPGVGSGTEARLQATSENNGQFSNRGDGTYTYQFATRLSDLPADILAQAEREGLSLAYEPARTHRVSIQFDGAPGKANPSYDWVPASGATEGIFTLDIAATANCNRCHDPLAIHGGGRREVAYCVTCHNPGSTDANSGNTVDMKVMIHKIHRGAGLPSVRAGGAYVLYGFRDSVHDYSLLRYPQDIRACANCHAGTATGAGKEDLVLTAQGDNWAEYSSAAACGSCHDDVDFSRHAGGQPDDAACASCHATGGPAGSVQHSHRLLVAAARTAFEAQVLGVTNSMPGQRPVVSFRVSNPLTGEPHDLRNDPVFTSPGARLAVGMAWNTVDFHNTGNDSDSADQVQVDALAAAVTNGDGSYSVTMPLALPDGSTAPGVSAAGSGMASVEGHPMVDVAGNGEPVAVPVGDATGFFAIDEADGRAVPRRQSVALQSCLACHDTLVLHGSNRADNIDSCASCHNPRNTDRAVREVALDAPTDGKPEESLDFKTMIHAIHAAGMREKPLQIVGFRGFSTHVYDTQQVHYPGDLANCTACHTADGFRLPLAETVLGTSIDTGDDRRDPADDTVVTPAAAVCASCHDDAVARAHMASNGGSFGTSQAAIDRGEVVEQCGVCHATGRSADVAQVHNPH